MRPYRQVTLRKDCAIASIGILVFYREQRVGDLEYSPHCLQVDPAIHTTITIDNLSVSDQLLIGRLRILQL